MKYLIITHVNHTKQNSKYFAYAPYVREMNIWLKHVDDVEIVAPLTNYHKTNIDIEYEHSKINFSAIPEIEFTSLKKVLLSIFKTPIILFAIFKACKRTDHIHLRCPGSIGLLACLVQIFFPKKIKTAKYAGNWDPSSKQPLSYRIQKTILSSTILTKHMQVLVYGNWKDQSKNIKSFFTATYSNKEIEAITSREYNNKLNFVFVGSLVDGKRPDLTIKIIEMLHKKGINVSLDLYGDGVLKEFLQDYIINNNLEKFVKIKGNVTKSTLKEAYKKAHFLLLPSKSEGWPKAIAEAMFFGVIPIATNVSCISWMLDEGRRGLIINSDLNNATDKILRSIENNNLKSLSIASNQWSQKYTLEVFESEIVKLLKAE